MISRVWKWLVALFVHEVVEQIKEEARKPDTITDESTPQDIKDRWRTTVADRLRDKDRGGE